MRSTFNGVAPTILLATAVGCGGNGGDTQTAASIAGAEGSEGERVFLPEGSRCEQVVPPEIAALGSADPNCTPRVDVIETDLNRDGHLDMRRVYLIPCPTMLGEQVEPEILCREADINFDGRKDLFHFFREGVSAYEEQDFDFDGNLDAKVWFADGNPVSLELDRNHDGRFEMQVLISGGQVRRVKVDAVGDEHYDIYETYEIAAEGGFSRLISIGYDLDGDGTMDRLLDLPDLEEPEPAPEPPPAPAAPPPAGGEE